MHVKFKKIFSRLFQYLIEKNINKRENRVKHVDKYGQIIKKNFISRVISEDKKQLKEKLNNKEMKYYLIHLFSRLIAATNRSYSNIWMFGRIKILKK